MQTDRIASVLSIAAVALVAGCGQELNPMAVPNAPPEVRFASPGVPLVGASEVVQSASWIGTDRDGQIDHYLVAVNPASPDRVDAGWTRTVECSRSIPVRRNTPLAASAGAMPAAPREPVILAVRAVDDRGAMSEVAVRAFFEDNVAPVVRITSPTEPVTGEELLVPPTMRIRWEGTDPDGQNTTRPVKYKYRLFRGDDPEFPLIVAILNPDSLRRFYAPGFAGWDSVPADSLSKTYVGLEPGRRYLFVITAFDEAGDYDPAFFFRKNMLRFRVGVPGTFGPQFTLFSDFFNYGYQAGGFCTDPSCEVPLGIPAKVPVTFHWFARPILGLGLSGYRWALDIADVLDETPRRHGRWDLNHWSAWSLNTTSATIGPFFGRDAEPEHRLYVEAMDELGQVSLAVLRLRIVRMRFDSDLLIVDDTRFRPDQGIPGRPDTVCAPSGPWPTAAELDTFLFARGGVRWRSYPSGTLSQPGILAGYEFDTLGTRTGASDPSIPLEVLGRYRHVVWIVDGKSATFTNAPQSLTDPMTALRWITGPGRVNTFAQYVERGGHLWLVGGGAGYASSITFNDRNNDRPLVTFSSLGARHELAPGRFMYEIPHWQSEFKVLTGQSIRIRRTPFPIGRHWPGRDYALLPEELAIRSQATDPVPPLRTAADFYAPYLSLEFLSRPGGTVLDCGPFPGREWLRPRLDTLLVATGGMLPAEGPDPARDHIVNPVMTRIGEGSGSVVFTGFDLWSFSRRDCARLADAVLQGMWRLNRAPAALPVAELEPVAIEPAVRAVRRSDR